MNDLPKKSSPASAPDLTILLQQIGVLLTEIQNGWDHGSGQAAAQIEDLGGKLAATSDAIETFGQSLMVLTEQFADLTRVPDRMDRIEARLQERAAQDAALLREIRALTALLSGPA